MTNQQTLQDVGHLSRLVSTVARQTRLDEQEELNDTLIDMFIPLTHKIGPANMMHCLLGATAKIMIEEEDQDLKMILAEFLIHGHAVMNQLVERLGAADA